MSLPQPAATVAILNDDLQSLKILMVQRHQNLANAGGAWAFPGGRVEDDDYLDTDDHFLAAQNAAVRETIEETGLCLDKDSLQAFAHWTTPPGPRRRFATWFFLTSITSPPEVRVDGEEIVDHCWLSPDEVLERHRQGRMQITPPGFVTLHRLRQHQNSDEALREFSQHELVHYNPKLVKTEQGRTIFYEGDAGYRNADVNAEGARNRIVMVGNEWQYHNTLI